MTALPVLMITAMATAEVQYWPHVNGTASSTTQVNGYTWEEETIILSDTFDFEAQKINSDGAETYSKLNIFNQPQQGNGGRYYTNIKGYYETFNGSSAQEWRQTWELTGSYDFTGLTNNYLQFGVNTNPIRELIVPEDAGDYTGAIAFTLNVNDTHVGTQGFEGDGIGAVGKELWEMEQSTLGNTGNWTLIIEFDGMGNTNQDIVNADPRFDAFIAVSDQSFSIPAPGVLAVLGLGGIAARRRRK